MMNISRLQEFSSAYFDCMLFTTTIYTENGTDTGKCLDDRYTPKDIAFDLRRESVSDCSDFLMANADDLAYVGEHLDGYTTEKAGHDFWLSRNGHGAGYFDRYHGKHAELCAAFQRLQDAAKVYGTVDVWADGKLVRGN
jgi:hypothetical protein